MYKMAYLEDGSEVSVVVDGTHRLLKLRHLLDHCLAQLLLGVLQTQHCAVA